MTNTMKTTENKHYETPQVELLEVEIEKGFATSDPNDFNYEEWN